MFGESNLIGEQTAFSPGWSCRQCYISSYLCDSKYTVVSLDAVFTPIGVCTDRTYQRIHGIHHQLKTQQWTDRNWDGMSGLGSTAPEAKTSPSHLITVVFDERHSAICIANSSGVSLTRATHNSILERINSTTIDSFVCVQNTVGYLIVTWPA